MREFRSEDRDRANRNLQIPSTKPDLRTSVGHNPDVNQAVMRDPRPAFASICRIGATQRSSWMPRFERRHAGFKQSQSHVADAVPQQASGSAGV